MSRGCGTLASPSGELLAKGTKSASSSNGKQHSLPTETFHQRIKIEDVKTHWDLKQPRNATRLWGTVKETSFGGYEDLDKQNTKWTSGEFWNVDSNIRKWGEHEVRRNAAASAHDIHRHDQIARVVLDPKPGATLNTGQEMLPKQSISGVISADCSFLEAFGFDLGLRDRQGRNTKLWKPNANGEMFRSERSFTRDIPRIAESFRSKRRTRSLAGSTFTEGVLHWKPEDIGGEAGDLQHPDDEDMLKQGRTHGSRSCRYHDSYKHTVAREAAKMNTGTFTPSANGHMEAHPFKENLELNPASVYTLKYKRFGEQGLRNHVKPSEKDNTHFLDRTLRRPPK